VYIRGITNDTLNGESSLTLSHYEITRVPYQDLSLLTCTLDSKIPC